jgi:hypothetical protein
MNTNQPTPPATAAEREAAAQEARQKGDFDQRIEVAGLVGDLNMLDHLRHARAARDLDATIDRRASLLGDVARAEARLARAGQLDKEAAGAELVRLRKELANVEGEINNLDATVRRGPLVTARSASEDWSDALTHRVLIRGFDGVRQAWFPVEQGLRGLRAAAEIVSELDPSLDVIIQDSRGFQYTVSADAMGRPQFRVIGADGQAHEILQGATADRVPLTRAGHAKLPDLDEKGRALYGRPLRIAELRDADTAETDQAMADTGFRQPRRDYSDKLRALFGSRLARRK